MTAAAAAFSSGRGINEFYFTMESCPEQDIEQEISSLRDAYDCLCRDYKCNETTEVFLRFHLRNMSIRKSVEKYFAPFRGYNSFISQPPASGAAAALEAIHFSASTTISKKIVANGCDVDLDNYRLSYRRAPELTDANPAGQTFEAFKTLDHELKHRGGSLKDNCIRTWIYCRDIDYKYADMVKARTEYFNSCGMTSDTHYIASTGIAGNGTDPKTYLCMDSLSIHGHSVEQMEFMRALEYMPHTHCYNVTFERGLRMIYGDRSRYYISGTASIDSDGRIMSPGNVEAQCERMIENVYALMNNHDASLDNLVTATVYLRNINDFKIVSEQLKKLLPDNLPRIIVHAPVCRPGWLVEMDAIAVKANGIDRFPVFC